MISGKMSWIWRYWQVSGVYDIIEKNHDIKAKIYDIAYNYRDTNKSLSL